MDSSPKRYADLHSAKLIEIALANNEGHLSDSGAFCTTTGSRTGRSAKDRFIVQECSTSDLIDWGKANQAFSNEQFEPLWNKAEDYVLQKDHFVNYLEVGDHPDYYLPIEVTTQTAWHSLFARNIFICPDQFNAKGKKKWRVLHAADFVCDPELDGTNSDAAVIIHFAKRKILIAGMQYAGELKKALFAVQNFLLPEKDVLPVRCSANVGEAGDVSLLFGISGTGKTTLNSNPKRYILGDDEHGWAKGSVFNLEGGCYAKTIDIDKEQEPVIWDAIRFGAIVENVVHNSYTHSADYNDTRHSKNGRCCYPLSHIQKRLQPSRSGEPNCLIFLSFDVLGILPAVAKLSTAAAAYHFLSGYTATTVRSAEPGGESIFRPIFSACFSSAFMPRPAMNYMKLLLKRIEESKCDIYLVNTGWNGGSYNAEGNGKRFPLSMTREIIRTIQNGDFKDVAYQTLDILNLDVPLHIPSAEIDDRLLNPQNAWESATEYEQQARHLAQLFKVNMERYPVNNEILLAGPRED